MNGFIFVHWDGQGSTDEKLKSIDGNQKKLSSIT